MSAAHELHKDSRLGIHGTNKVLKTSLGRLGNFLPSETAVHAEPLPNATVADPQKCRSSHQHGFKISARLKSRAAKLRRTTTTAATCENDAGNIEIR